MILRIFIATVLLMSCLRTNAKADWLIFSKPEFKGRLVDSATGEPIDGAVVAAIYKKWSLGLGAGMLSSIIDIREVITDKNGSFQIPSYTTMMQPFSTSAKTTFVIYKPGYAYIGELGLEDILSGKASKDYELAPFWDSSLKLTFSTTGIIKIPKVTAIEFRKKSMPGLPSSLEFLEKQKNIIRLINEEEMNLGLKKSDPYKAREYILNMGK